MLATFTFKCLMNCDFSCGRTLPSRPLCHLPSLAHSFTFTFTFTFHTDHFHFFMPYKKVASVVAGRFLAGPLIISLDLLTTSTSSFTFTFHNHHFHFFMPREKVASVVAGRFLAGLFVISLASISPSYISTVAPR